MAERPETLYYEIPREVFGTGITDAVTFNAAMDWIDAILKEGIGTWRPPVSNFAALPVVGNDPGDARVTLDTGAIYQWTGTAWKLTIPRTIIDQVSTGWSSGGAVNRSGGLNLAVSGGSGTYNDNAGNLIEVTWAPASLTMPVNSVKNIVVDSSGAVSLEDPPADFTNEFTLATAESNGVDVILLVKHYADVKESTGRYHEYFRDILGSVCVSHLYTTPAAVPLRLDVSAGVYYISDFKVAVPATAPVTFTYWRMDGIGGWVKTSGQTTVDTANYDGGGGALIPVPGGEWKKDLLYVAYSDDGPEYHVVYGQTTFASQFDAEQGAIPVSPDQLVLGAARSGGVVVGSGAAVIASIVDHRVFIGQQSPAISGPVDHGSLAGLGHDDHFQYLLHSGARAMSGNLDMGGNSVINVNLVDDVDVSAHAPRHISGGADPFVATDILEAAVKRLQEAGGPTILLAGTIPDATFLTRSGTSIIGVTRQGTSPWGVSPGDNTGPGANTNGAVPAIVRYKRFPGTTIFGTPTTVIGVMESSTVGRVVYADIYDVTNGLLIATISTTAAVPTITASVTPGNLPAGPAIFAVRIYRGVQATTCNLYDIQMY